MIPERVQLMREGRSGELVDAIPCTGTRIVYRKHTLLKKASHARLRAWEAHFRLFLAMIKEVIMKLGWKTQSAMSY
jgi:hypothetical protein